MIEIFCQKIVPTVPEIQFTARSYTVMENSSYLSLCLQMSLLSTRNISINIATEQPNSSTGYKYAINKKILYKLSLIAEGSVRINIFHVLLNVHFFFLCLYGGNNHRK